MDPDDYSRHRLTESYVSVAITLSVWQCGSFAHKPYSTPDVHYIIIITHAIHTQINIYDSEVTSFSDLAKHILLLAD